MKKWGTTDDLRRLRRENPESFLHELESLAESARTSATRSFWAALAEAAETEREQGRSGWTTP